MHVYFSGSLLHIENRKCQKKFLSGNSDNFAKAKGKQCKFDNFTKTQGISVC